MHWKSTTSSWIQNELTLEIGTAQDRTIDFSDTTRSYDFKQIQFLDATGGHYRIAVAQTTSIPEQNYLIAQEARLAGL